jgi:hypothetical protein
MTYKYCVAECWGKGFITHSDASKFQVSGFPGNVWQIPANSQDANLWVNKVAGILENKSRSTSNSRCRSCRGSSSVGCFT